MEEAKAMLKNLGLTEYESKAYVTLVKFGILTAEKISDLGQIPLPRVYDTITELQKKGFVLVSGTRPKKFRAVEIKKALESFIEIQEKTAQENIKALRNESKLIHTALEAVQKISISADTEDVWTVTKKVNVQKSVFDLMRNAKKEIVIFSGDLSWINDFAPLVKKISGKVRMRAIIKPIGENRSIEKNVKKAEKLGVEVREGLTEGIRAFVFDNEKAALIKKVSIGPEILESGATGTEDKFSYKLMEISDPEIVKIIKQNFEFWWKKLS